MKTVTVINHFKIQPGKLDEFIQMQSAFAKKIRESFPGLVGGRMYKEVEGNSAVLVSQFESIQAQEDIRHSEVFKNHVVNLQRVIEGASPGLYEEAYTVGNFQ